MSRNRILTYNEVSIRFCFLEIRRKKRGSYRAFEGFLGKNNIRFCF